MLRSRQGWSWSPVLLAACVLPGCLHEQDQVRQALAGPLGRPQDVQATAAIGPAITPLPKAGAEVPAPPPGVEELPTPRKAGEKVPPPRKEWLKVPEDLPGADAPPLKLPALDRTGDPKKLKEREEAVRKIYPTLDPLGPAFVPAPGPGGKALTLADLQALAAENSPVLKRNLADVLAARGAAIQAGAYPNPTVAYQAQSAGTSGGPTVGGSVQQVVKTAGKLKLSQAAAEMDLRTAEVAFRAAQNDLATQVRAGYFAVVVAQEQILVAQALAQLTDEAFIFQRQLVLRTATAAPYEPLQIYVQAKQARLVLVQARNRYVSAWKQLAATLNRPEMPPTLLAGRADAPVPLYQYDRVLQHMLANHTDVQTAEIAIQKARYNLRLQEVTPVPDVTLSGTLFNDLTPPGPASVVASVNVGVTIPVWDQNRGAIQQARGQLAHAVEDLQRARNDLTTRLADAFERYQNNRILVAEYRTTILSQQVRVYRAVRARYQLDPETIGFADIFTSQQALAGVLQSYLTGLQALWTAVGDVANLLQTDDLYQYGQEACGPSGLPLSQLLKEDPIVPPAQQRPVRLLPPELDSTLRLDLEPAARPAEPLEGPVLLPAQAPRGTQG